MTDTTVRLDVWLDVACLYRTRSEAQRACHGGKVEVNGQSSKPHRQLKIGDDLRLSRPFGRKQTLTVVGARRAACPQGRGTAALPGHDAAYVRRRKRDAATRADLSREHAAHAHARQARAARDCESSRDARAVIFELIDVLGRFLLVVVLEVRMPPRIEERDREDDDDESERQPLRNRESARSPADGRIRAAA